MSRAVRITTGARLHFGLLDIAAPFGGCGVMIDEPSTIIEVEPAGQFVFFQNDGEADHRERATNIARRIAASLRLDTSLPHVAIRVARTAPSHTGLGSGTQLSLAVSEAVLRVLQPDAWENAFHHTDSSLRHDVWFAAADRGRRSAVGTHGYLQGGFIAEGLRPRNDSASLNSIDTRLDLPQQWRVTVMLPAGSESSAVETVSGEQEQAKFSSLPPVSNARRESLTRLLNEALVPAIERADFSEFCIAVARYNRSSGELFAGVQGGAYNGEATTRLIERLHASGQVGIGQSSWGPGVFVWHPDEIAANEFHEQWRRDAFRLIVARPKPSGRLVEIVSISDR